MHKQLDVGFIKVVHYPQQVASIVPVPNKDGRVRMYVDLRDLNKTRLKDDFWFPDIDILVDNTASYTLLYFMNGFTDYNQPKMATKDNKKTTFITPWGTIITQWCRLDKKDVEATYQRTATTLLHDLLDKEVDVYVHDMIIKSKQRDGYIQALQKIFTRHTKYNVHLNPHKCAYAVISTSCLGTLLVFEELRLILRKFRQYRNGAT